MGAYGKADGRSRVTGEFETKETDYDMINGKKAIFLLPESARRAMLSGVTEYPNP
jgi:hypothetical protein